MKGNGSKTGKHWKQKGGKHDVVIGFHKYLPTYRVHVVIPWVSMVQGMCSILLWLSLLINFSLLLYLCCSSSQISVLSWYNMCFVLSWVTTFLKLLTYFHDDPRLAQCNNYNSTASLFCRIGFVHPNFYNPFWLIIEYALQLLTATSDNHLDR